MALASRLTDLLTRGAFRLPQAVLTKLDRHPVVNRHGDHLAPELHLLLKLAERGPHTPISAVTPESVRATLSAQAAMSAETFAPFAIEEQLSIPGPAGPIAATRYRAGRAQTPALVLYFHGGGWVAGDRATTESPVRLLAREAGVDVLSVEYRLAPEHPYPAAVEDTRAAWDFAVASAPGWGIDPGRIAIAGDSSGANLAAVLTNSLRSAEVAPAYQLLWFPVTDVSRAAAEHHDDSYTEFASGFFLTPAYLDWYTEHYVGAPSSSDPKVSPLLEPDLAGVPPTFISVAGFDPLRDQGLAYAKRLREAGVVVTEHRAGSMIHGYTNMTGISRGARAATLEAIVALRTALA